MINKNTGQGKLIRFLHAIAEAGIPPGMSPEEARNIRFVNIAQMAESVLMLGASAIFFFTGLAIEAATCLVFFIISPFSILLNRFGFYSVARLGGVVLVNLFMIGYAVALRWKGATDSFGALFLIFITIAYFLVFPRKEKWQLMTAVLLNVAGAAVTLGIASSYFRSGGPRIILLNSSPFTMLFVTMLCAGIIFRRVILSTEEALRREREKSESLLLNILPAPIAQRLKDGEATIADRYEEVTILFADIVGFTPLSERMVPDDLVGLLNRIFTAFDRLADRHGLEKIKTIGDAYMVAGGLPQRRADHAQAVARMALDMQTAIAAFADPEGRPLQLRIGIHTGPAAAGVIGARKFIYDVWSDTVNTASRMESHSFPAKIQVTQETYGRLKDAFLFEDRGEIMIKGKGAMRTYFLCGIKVGVPSPSEALGSAGSSLAICAETSSGPEKRNPSKPVAGSS